MTTYNTGNPLGSTSPKDLYDNAENLDQAVNSAADTWVDRFGETRLTMAKALQLQATGEVNVYFAATKSAGNALASSLPDGATVIVTADESQGGVRVRYTVASGVLGSAVLDTTAMARFTPAGTGAVAHTAQAKLRELSSTSLFSGTESIRVFDDFDDIDQPLNGRTAPSGNVWSVSGPGAATAAISNGVFVHGGNNCYASLQYGAAVKRLQGAFSFVRSANANPTDYVTPQVVLIAQQSSLDLGTMIHWQITAKGWSIQKRLSGGSFVTLSGGEYEIRADGTVYSAEMLISGSTVILNHPDGSTSTLTDSDFVTIAATAGTWQIQQDTAQSAYVPRWHGVSIGKAASKLTIPAAGTASASEVRWLTGDRISKRARIDRQVISTTGWYKIADSGIVGTFLGVGKIKLAAETATGLSTLAEIWVAAEASGTPILEQKNCYVRGSAPLSQIRVSTSGSNVSVEALFPDATANPVTFSADFEGVFNPVRFPLASSALSNPVVLKLATPAISYVGATLTANGWHTIATAALAAGFEMCGTVKIQAISTGRICLFKAGISARSDTTLSVIEILESGVITQTPIDQIRLSRNVSGALQLDINCPYATATPLEIQVFFDGTFTPVLTPVTGATALATESIVQTIEDRRVKIRPALIGAFSDRTFIYALPSSGDTVSIGANQTGVHIVQGALAALTVAFPTSPAENQEVEVATVNAITALTLTATGHTISGAATTLAANSSIRYRFRSANATWYKIR